MKLSITLENYIKTIGELIKKNKVARVKDIAKLLDVKLSTVTSTLKTLSDKGIINYEPYKYITLTSKGNQIAEELIRKKQILANFFEEILNIPEEDAIEMACEMEHSISSENLEKFQKFLVFLDTCPVGGIDLKEKFKEFQRDSNYIRNCEECINKFLENCPENNIAAENTTTLNKLAIGDKAQIIKVKKNPLLARRFSEMGGVAGSIIRVEKVAPLGDPISIKVKGTELSIRKEEAENIVVKKIDK